MNEDFYRDQFLHFCILNKFHYIDISLNLFLIIWGKTAEKTYNSLFLMVHWKVDGQERMIKTICIKLLFA